jgi:hypothetical protein
MKDRFRILSEKAAHAFGTIYDSKTCDKYILILLRSADKHIILSQFKRNQWVFSKIRGF